MARDMERAEMEINGHCDERFSVVRDAFEANFRLTKNSVQVPQSLLTVNT